LSITSTAESAGSIEETAELGRRERAERQKNARDILIVERVSDGYKKDAKDIPIAVLSLVGRWEKLEGTEGKEAVLACEELCVGWSRVGWR
jgi:hypothetical protein